MSDWHSAREIVGRLKGRWSGSSGSCRCPAHADRSPSLSVTQTRDGRVLVHCFTGCGQADVIAALQAKGLWPAGPVVGDPSYPGRLTTPYDRSYKDRGEREARENARDIWDAARPAKGTAVEDYLRARGIKVPPSGWDQLRYSPRLKHPSGSHFRAMIARISDSRGFCAVQRTFLDKDRPAKADIMPNKMSRGPMGGGAVRLRMPVSDTLGIAEGIETALSASQLYSYAVWATLSVVRLTKIDIPPAVRFLCVFGDPGDVGREEAFRAADEYERRGLGVEVVFPAAHFQAGPKCDFNNVLSGNLARKYE